MKATNLLDLPNGPKDRFNNRFVFRVSLAALLGPQFSGHTLFLRQIIWDTLTR